jgi:hypothetical protein
VGLLIPALAVFTELYNKTYDFKKYYLYNWCFDKQLVADATCRCERSLLVIAFGGALTVNVWLSKIKQDLKTIICTTGA